MKSVPNNLLNTITLCLSLLMLSSLAAGLMVMRMIYSQQWTYFFLLWNLFLAWLPLLFVLLAQAIPGRFWRYGIGLLWLLFLPNAPYLITDLMHLVPAGNVPLWYDAAMLFVFALTGLFLGLQALRRMQQLVQEDYGRAAGWLVVFSAGILSSFGVYAGRFWRWNSWDALLDPGRITNDLLHVVTAPGDQLRTIFFVLLFSAIYLGAYLFLYYLSAQRPGTYFSSEWHK